MMKEFLIIGLSLVCAIILIVSTADNKTPDYENFEGGLDYDEEKES